MKKQIKLEVSPNFSRKNMINRDIFKDYEFLLPSLGEGIKQKIKYYLILLNKFIKFIELIWVTRSIWKSV